MHVSAINTNLCTEGSHRPAQLALYPKTVLVGDFGVGKSRVRRTIEWVLRGFIYDGFGRDVVAASADLNELSGDDRKLTGTITFDNGVTLSRTAGDKGEAHSEWSVPVAHVREKFRSSADKTAHWLVPILCPTDAPTQVSPAYAKPDLPNGGSIPATVGELIAGINTAQDTIAALKMRSTELESQRAGILALPPIQAVDPNIAPPGPGFLVAADTTIEQARAEYGRIVQLDHQRREVEGRRASLSGTLAEVQGRLSNAISWISWAEQVVPYHTAWTLEGVRLEAAFTMAKANWDNLAVGTPCASCGGRPVEPAVRWAFGAIKDWRADWEHRRRPDAEQAANTIEAARRDIAELQGRVNQMNEELAKLPDPNTFVFRNVQNAVVPVADAAAILRNAESVHLTLTEGVRRQHALGQIETEQIGIRERIDFWTRYLAHLVEKRAQHLKQAVAGFEQDVQKYLPATTKFKLYIPYTDADRSICRLGLAGDRRGMSAGQEAMVWLAVTVALLDRLPPGTRPEYAMLALPVERGWPADRLAEFLGCLSTVPWQVVIESHTSPSTLPAGWTEIRMSHTQPPVVLTGDGMAPTAQVLPTAPAVSSATAATSTPAPDPIPGHFLATLRVAPQQTLTAAKVSEAVRAELGVKRLTTDRRASFLNDLIASGTANIEIAADGAVKLVSAPPAVTPSPAVEQPSTSADERAAAGMRRDLDGGYVLQRLSNGMYRVYNPFGGSVISPEGRPDFPSEAQALVAYSAAHIADQASQQVPGGTEDATDAATRAISALWS